MRLTKSRDNVVMSGVLGGLGEYYNVDPTLLRIGFVVLIFLNVFPLIPLYIIGALIIPEAPREDRERPKRREQARRQAERHPDRERRHGRGRPKDFRNNRRREFESAPREDFEPYSSSKVNDIDEDDWSDF